MVRQYAGAVCYVDILGIGALTQKQVPLTELDYGARGLVSPTRRNEQVFCAHLLTDFRKCLREVRDNFSSVNLAQLSDCAFVWSKNVLDVLNACRSLMWSATRNGLLCRGGLAFGEIVEPNKIDHSIGHFVLGEAATKAVGIETAGKGCRVFSDVDLPRHMSGMCRCRNEPFEGLKNPLNTLVTDEFRWYLFPANIKTNDPHSPNDKDGANAIMELVSRLRYDPRFNWNTSTEDGRLHIASSIESISSMAKGFVKELDYKWTSESLLAIPENTPRSEAIVKRFLTRYKNEIAEVIDGRRSKRPVKRRK